MNRTTHILEPNPAISSPAPTDDWMQNDSHPYPLSSEKEDKNPEALHQLLEKYLENISQNIDKEKPVKKKICTSCQEASPIIIPNYFPPSIATAVAKSSSPLVYRSIEIPEECTAFLDTLCIELLQAPGAGPDSITTLTLERKDLIGTPFYGSTVTIEGYNTAPRIFNVTIKTGQESAIALVQAHIADFIQYIQNKKFSFSINQIQAGYLDEFSSSEQEESSTDPDQGRSHE